MKYFEMKKYSRDRAERIVARSPAPRPPYQELSITAIKNSEKWLGSARAGMSSAKAKAKPGRTVATAYRSSAGRSLIMVRLHQSIEPQVILELVHYARGDLHCVSSYHTPPRGLDPTDLFQLSFRSRRADLCSIVVRKSRNSSRSVHGGHTGLPKCRTERVCAGVLRCSCPCCGISAPREVSQGKIKKVVFSENTFVFFFSS